MRISDWSSDVCSSDLTTLMDENARRAEPWDAGRVLREALIRSALDSAARAVDLGLPPERIVLSCKVSGVQELIAVYRDLAQRSDFALHLGLTEARSEEHTSELQSLMRISYAVFCLK